MTQYVAVVPGVPALLPGNRGQSDPVAELRAACREAVAWLTKSCPSRITVTSAPAARVRALSLASSLLAESGFVGDLLTSGSTADADGLLVIANGSARRGEKAPGHLDPRAFGFDEEIEVALGRGDAAALGRIDLELGDALLAEGVEGLRSLSRLAPARITPTMLYADDPFGVRYWVVTWECAS